MLQIKKIFSIFISTLLVFTSFLVVCFAEDYTDPYSYETIEVNSSELGSYRFGDLDRDNRITPKDARFALRVSARLETPDEKQKYAIDVFGDGKISAKNARKILRVSAKLDKMDSIKATIELGETYMVDGLQNFDAPGYWLCECDKASTYDLKAILYVPAVTIPGGMSRLAFVVTPKEKGTYTLKVSYKNSAEQFNNCFESITLEVI